MPSQINNEFYNELGEDWYQADDHAIALLRAEQKVKNNWVHNEIQKNHPKAQAILDIACGGGFLSNSLAPHYARLCGVDASPSSIEIAKKHDETKKVEYQVADAYKLPFADAEFDVVCLMDFLEHIEDPEKIIIEATRVLKPGGLLFYHTFNRNILSYLIIIKAVEWLVPDAPKNLHIYRLFIKPVELLSFLRKAHLTSILVLGLKPKFDKYFFKSIMKRKVLPEFDFELTQSTTLAYLGMARK